jgi:general transcription factor 3C polypeptide 5 (transcription factor C subunit 1)
MHIRTLEESHRRLITLSTNEMPSPGSSGSEYNPDEGKQPTPGPSSAAYAPFRSFSKATYASVEYPSTVSHPAAILRLVSQEDIDECFNAPSTATPQLEIRYGSTERAGIPVRGARVPSQKLLLKLTRRRRRRYEDEDGEGEDGSRPEQTRQGAEEGIVTSEVVGPITQTVRFRGEIAANGWCCR